MIELNLVRNSHNALHKDTREKIYRKTDIQIRDLLVRLDFDDC